MSRTIAELIKAYRDDENSGHHKLSFSVRIDRERYLSRLEKDFGSRALSSISSQTVGMWYRRWTDGRKFAVGNAFIGQLRAIVRHGFLSAEDEECYRVLMALDNISTRSVKPRGTQLTEEHANAVRAKAREVGYFSVALAQAFQYELMLPQREVIGEWLPRSEARDGILSRFDDKVWIGGLRWEQIDENWILTHKGATCKGRIDLKQAPMVREELSHVVAFYRNELRGALPKSGPVIIYEASAQPWNDKRFREVWRKLANIVNVPREFKNRDSHGGVTNVPIAGRYYHDLPRKRPGQR
ncbi:hypothetical protein GGD66_005678 [Bradyrhizobium sp. CIR48]|uniref:hypothetical protein n=1 Tax=Bradyrhizobium sp. CIR48 TaxID=2663840 RepID=UPI0016062F90|nr:hypothetical protein [Bradyrhizobium sp. CIR48]MBB4427102.1 hypothetical protein [Bradyrhizobium sp. CIR48]